MTLFLIWHVLYSLGTGGHGISRESWRSRWRNKPWTLDHKWRWRWWSYIWGKLIYYNQHCNVELFLQVDGIYCMVFFFFLYFRFCSVFWCSKASLVSASTTVRTALYITWQTRLTAVSSTFWTEVDTWLNFFHDHVGRMTLLFSTAGDNLSSPVIKEVSPHVIITSAKQERCMTHFLQQLGKVWHLSTHNLHEWKQTHIRELCFSVVFLKIVQLVTGPRTLN